MTLTDLYNALVEAQRATPEGLVRNLLRKAAGNVAAAEMVLDHEKSVPASR